MNERFGSALEMEIASVASRDRLHEHEVEILRATIAGVARDALAPGVPRDTVKTWIRILLRKTRATNLLELALRVARDASARSPTPSGISGELDALSRAFADDVHAMLKHEAVRGVRARLAGVATSRGPRSRRRSQR